MGTVRIMLFAGHRPPPGEGAFDDHVILRWDQCHGMRRFLSFDGVHNFLDTLFGDDLRQTGGVFGRGHARGIEVASLGSA